MIGLKYLAIGIHELMQTQAENEASKERAKHSDKANRRSDGNELSKTNTLH